MKNIKIISALITAGILLSGCSDKVIAPRIDDRLQMQEERLEQVRLDNSSFKRHSLPFVAAQTFEEPEPRPSFLKRKVFVEAQANLGLKYYTSKLAAQIGKPVRIGQDIYSIDQSIGEELQTTDTSTSDPESTANVIDTLVTANQVKLSPLSMREQVRFIGTAEQALDSIASTFNVHWKHDNLGVMIYKLETRSFRLGLLMEEALTVNFEGSATDSDTAGGLTSKIESKYYGASFEKYTETIDSMLSPYGDVHAVPSSGAIIVTDSPEYLDTVASFIENENKNLLKQVALNVEVVMVSSSNGKDVGIVWDQLLADLGDVSLTAISKHPQLAPSILTNVSGQINAGRLSGSNILLKALATKARVSILTRETRTVINNTPAQFRDISIIEYPSESTQSTDSGVTTVTTTKGIIRPGFDMSILPRILDDNRVILNVVTTMSRDLPFDVIQTGETIQKFANLTLKELKTTEVIRDGTTAMLTGYVSSDLSSNEEGTGRSDMWALGGGSSTSEARDLLIIFVTPYIDRV